MSVRVAFVIVSHSAALAAGVCELAAQMAPDVPFDSRRRNRRRSHRHLV